MTGLALLPLDTRTLPGWPAAEDPSGIEMLFVLVAIPAAITLLIVIFNTVAKLASTNRATSTGVIAESPSGAPEVAGPGSAQTITTGRRAPAGATVAAEAPVKDEQPDTV